MRQIGTLENEKEARRFVDYLVTQGVSASAESDGTQSWSIWVREEDRVSDSREQLDQFRDNPTDPRYMDVERQAASVRQRQQARAQQIRKKKVDMRRRWEAPIIRRAPSTVLLMAISVVVFLATGMGPDADSMLLRSLLFVDPVVRAQQGVGPWHNIQQGEVWRLVTPIFIHFGILHIAFNLFILHAIGAAVETREGTPFYGTAVLGIAIASNLLQLMFVPDIPFGGLSGVVYGLFGYVWYRSWMDPRSGYFISRELILILVFWLVLGFTGVLSRVGLNLANWAHLGGLVAGALVGALRTRH